VCLAALAPAGRAATERNLGGRESGALPAGLKAAEPVSLPGSSLAVTSSFGCTGRTTDCGLARSRYAYFLTVRLGPTWRAGQPLTFTINATFDPSLSSNNSLGFGVVDEAGAGSGPGRDEALGSRVSDCMKQGVPAAQATCVDGFLASARETGTALSFVVQPSYSFGGQTVRLRPGDTIVLYATSYAPPDCAQAPPQPVSLAEWTCTTRAVLDISDGSESLAAQSAFAPAAQAVRRLRTSSAYFRDASPGRVGSPSVSVFDARGGPFLRFASMVRCMNEPGGAGPCGRTFQAATPVSAPVLPSEYVYLYTLTFQRAWNEPLALAIEAPFDPAGSREFGQVSFGILRDAGEASDPTSPPASFPPAPCASLLADALAECLDGLLLTRDALSSSPLVFTLNPGDGGFATGDTLVLFATSFYAPAGCAFPANGAQRCSAGAPLTIRDSIGGALAEAFAIGPAVPAPPVPSLTAIQSGASLAGSQAMLSLELMGAASGGESTLDTLNFVRGSRVLWNGTALPGMTEFDGISRLAVPVPAEYAAGQVAEIAVRNPALNPDDPGQVSASLRFAPADNPLPIISSLSPPSIVAGGPEFALTVTGTNFVNGATVQAGGAPPLPATFNDSTSVTATIPATDIVHVGPILISVINPPPGGGTSNALQLQVVAALPPAIAMISPATAVAGAGPVTLSVTGSNFAVSAVVQVNNTPVSTVFNSESSLTATVPASAIAAAGPISITVLSPSLGGMTSNSIALQVTDPAPTVSSLTPGSVTAGGPTLSLAVTGTNFVGDSIVQANGASVPTVFVSPTSLTATIPASSLASGGILSIAVFNPSPGGGTSGTLPLTVLNPAPAVTSLSPAAVLAGSSSFSLTILGTSFLNGATVQVNTTQLSPLSVSPGTVNVMVPASLLAAAASLAVSVSNPGPGGGASGALMLAVTDFGISPASGMQAVAAGQTASFTINLATQVGALPAAVSFACGGLPNASTCSFTPGSVPGGSTSGSVTMAVATTARASVPVHPAIPPWEPDALLRVVGVALAAVLLVERRMLARPRLAALLVAAAFLASCGGGSTVTTTPPPPPPAQGTPAGTYMITVTASTGTATRTATVTLQVN